MIVHAVQLAISAYMARDNLSVASQAIHISVIVFVGIVVLNSFAMNRSSFNELYVKIMEGFHYDDFGSLSVEKITENHLNLKRKLTYIIPMYILTMGGMIVVATPVADYLLGYEKPKFINGVNMRISIPMWTFYSTESFSMALITSVFQVWLAVVVVSVLIIGVLGIILFKRHIIYHLKIMLYSITHLEQRAINRFHMSYKSPVHKNKLKYYSDNRFNSCYHESLVLCVKHHQIIIR